ncbi:MAG: TonB-dependent receptor [Bacteroidota bacterium]
MGPYLAHIKKLVVILLCFSGSLLLGQNRGGISGVVLDAESAEPMLAVSISVDKRTGTISDIEGKFILELSAGTHTLELYYVGYKMVRKEVRLAAGEQIHLDIMMKVRSRMLDEVVVSAGKYEQKISDVTVSMELIKPHQLSNQNIVSLDMILEKTPGISILDGQPSIRGGSGFSYGVGSRVLMLVDDLPMISADAGDIKWDYMPVENLNQIEVIKGASSVLFGSSALNGAINLRTRFPGNKPKTEVTLFGGAYLEPKRKEMVWWDRNPLTAGASFSHLRKIGNLDLSVGGNYFKNEGYRTGDYQHSIRGNLGLRYKFKKIERLSAGVSMSGMYVDKADFLLWQDADSGIYIQNPSTVVPLTGHRYNIDPYLEYYTPDGDKHTLKTRLYSVGNATLDVARNSFSKLWYGEYRYLKKFGSRTNWTSGLSFSRNTILANLYEDHKGSNTAIYSQLDAQIANRLKLSSGVRWEMNSLNGELFYSLPVLRAGLNYQVGKATFIRSSFGQGYRFPSVAEKFASGEFAGLHIFANPGLEPERGWSAEVGIKQGFKWSNWMAYADLALFWTEYNNMIEYTFGAFPPDSVEIPGIEHVGFKALNIGSARINGAELTFNGMGTLGPVGLVLSGGYTFMNPVDPSIIEESGKGEDEAYILKYRRRHLFKADLEAELWKVFAGMNLQYNSRMINVDEAFIDNLVGNLLQPGFPGYWDEHAGGYTLIDFRLGWNITEMFRINTILKNAFNVEYLGRPGDIGPPRNITLQAKVTF